MKLNDLYSRTKAVMFEKSTSTTYDGNIIEAANLIIAETFTENNMCRIFYGKKPLTDIPLMTSLESDVPYEEELLREVLPYGIAALLLIDDDLSKHALYANKYDNARVLHQKIVDEGDYDALNS